MNLLISDSLLTHIYEQFLWHRGHMSKVITFLHYGRIKAFRW